MAIALGVQDRHCDQGRTAFHGAESVSRQPSNERCSRQALFGCGFAAMVVVCLQLN
jgi:hypothetical protein